MGIRYLIELEDGIIYAMAEGKITPENILAYRRDLRADPKFNGDLCEIIDFRLSHLLISFKEAADLATTILDYHVRRSAIVSEAHWLEIPRWLAVRHKDPTRRNTIKVFKDLGSAKDWIDSDKKDVS